MVVYGVNKSESFLGVVTSCRDDYFYSFRDYTAKREVLSFAVALNLNIRPRVADYNDVKLVYYRVW